MKVSIISPVFNSSSMLEELVQRINKTMDNLNLQNNYELVLINDASKDDSWKIIVNLVKKFSFVKGINLKENFGQHNAIMAGLNNCTGEFIITIDDDLQHPPEFISDILNKLNPNIVLVGLNISQHIPRDFGNFHPEYTSGQDYKTRYATQDTIFEGAYMTDVIKDFSEKASGKMMKYLKQNKDFEIKNIESFEEELVDIGSKNPILVALGNDSYNILKRNLGDKYKIFKVTHYSAFINKDKYKEEFLNLTKNF